jgi:RNA polymerase sigma-B factor
VLVHTRALTSTAAEETATASPADLIATHVSLARSLARRFSRRGESIDDLVQVAMVGLVKAASRFDQGHNTRFSTFATATITGELKRHFRDNRWGVHVSRSSQERYLLVRDATEWAREDLGRSPTVSEIAALAGLAEEDVLEAQELSSAFHVETIDGGRGDDGGVARVQLGSIDMSLAAVDNHVSLTGLLASLPEREREILRRRFVQEMTQSEIATAMGISQMQVSRILGRTLGSFRKALLQ